MSLNCLWHSKYEGMVKLKHQFNLNNNLYFNWMQLIHSLPQKRKNAFENNRISENFLFLNHHLIKCNILLNLEKLNSEEIYLIQLTRDFCKPASQICFEKHFKNCVLDWKCIYILQRIVTSDPCTRYFQYKVLNNVRYLNEKFFFFLFYLKLLNVLFVTKITKQLSIPFVTALLQKCFGIA